MDSTKHRAGISKSLGSYGFIFIFVFIFAAFWITNSGALTVSGAFNVLRHSVVVGIIALGMGLVIITGGIDLSVGSMLALVSGLSVDVFNGTNSTLLTLLFALAMGAACGLINGVLVGKVKMPAFIATLGTMMIYRSLAQYYLRATAGVSRRSIFNMDGTLSAYANFYGFGQAKVFSVVPVAGLVLIAAVVAMVFISTSTKFGKRVYAVGGNERAAQLAGVNVALTRVTVFVIAGLLCGLASFLGLAMQGSVDPATLGKSNEMYAIAAVVIGGISMSGGKGKLLGVLFGALSYTSIDKIIAALKLDALINDTIKGAILLVAVLVQLMVPVLRVKAKELFRRSAT
jgi:ribose transport system permease protein